MGKLVDKIAAAERHEAIHHSGGDHENIQKVARSAVVPEVAGEIARIVADCDPIGFLSDIVNGKPIQGHFIDKEGVVHEYHETATLSQRISVARYLGDKYMPKVAVYKHAHLVKRVPDEKQTRMDQILDHAHVG